MHCLNLDTCCVICVLNVPKLRHIRSKMILIYRHLLISLENVMPNFREHAKYLLNFWHFAKLFAQNI